MVPKILVVDDDVEGAKLLALILQSEGYDVDVAFSGDEAIEKARAWQPAIVFLDIRMPGLGGHEVAEILRRNTETEDLALIAITGWPNELDEKRAERHGFDLYLTKPIDIRFVNRLLRESLSDIQA